MENLNTNLISFLLSPPFEGWLLLAKILFMVFTLLLLAGTVVFLLVSTWLRFMLVYDAFEFLTFRPYGVRKVEKIWRKTTGRLDTGFESEYKLAVIEADSMLDDILKKMGFGGETLGERLGKITSATLPNIEEIKKVHQTRNNIIHDPDYRLSLDEAKKVVAVYEKAFRDLEAM